uniref:Serine/threonine-protein phosphatase PGAM5, mitochondrial n=1 Tax=Bursaphelenchus xylophilus TaxID=6326 RepID=A0A1I7SRL1_BURXY
MWRSRKVLATAATAAVLGGTTYAYGDQLKVRTAYLLSQEPTIIDQSQVLFPRQQWDSNWDQRDPMSMVNKEKYLAADPEKRKEMLEEHKPKATRNIFLIRHGQYHLDSEKRNLTPLGQEQAQLLGERLAKTNIKYDVCVMSTMNRATETALLMLEKMDPTIPKESDSLLEEGAPYPPEPPLSSWKPSQKFYTEGARIEAAFRKYIHRASPRQKHDSYELIVCHANVIRYFVCRALQFPREGWLRLSLGNSSITWMVLRPNGAVSIRGLGDFGHLPHDKVSFT